jgi:hypothetical protein
MNQKINEGSMKWVVEDPQKEGVWWPSSELKKMAWVSDESNSGPIALARASIGLKNGTKPMNGLLPTSNGSLEER